MTIQPNPPSPYIQHSPIGRPSGTASVSDREAYMYAIEEQGYTGSFDDFTNMDAADFKAYEDGANGIGTV